MIGLTHLYRQASLRTDEHVRARKVSAGVLKEPNFFNTSATLFFEPYLTHQNTTDKRV